MLTLPIKKHWLDMIASGEKREEYRDDTRYYERRFDKYIGLPVKVKFRNGYRKDSPSVICTVVPRYGVGRPEWGAEPGKGYIVLAIMDMEAQEQITHACEDKRSCANCQNFFGCKIRESEPNNYDPCGEYEADEDG